MPLLEIDNLHAAYGDGVEVLHGISLTAEKGEFVTLIGANGAGKTTTLRSIMGLLRARPARSVSTDKNIAALPTPEIARLGISLVPEGRGVFPGLTVYENLRIAATPWLRAGNTIERELEPVYGCFRSWPNGAISSAGPCRADSSRCWRSAARCSRARN